MSRRILMGVFLGLLFSVSATATEVLVNLFTGHTLRQIEVGHHSGRYMIRSGSEEIITLSQGERCVVRINDSLLELLDGEEVRATGKRFEITGVGLQNSFELQSAAAPVRYYDDHLMLEVHHGAIRLTNRIDLEKYVAGVIQAEAGGSTRNVEYFMVQAMVCRTYAMRLILQHGSEFRLTDDVSNQVYKGRPVTPEVIEAVNRTTGEVILYDDSNLINAVFHSNSGGYTMASEDVWLSALPYLRPVVDTFSVDQRNGYWVHRMPVVEWVNYLESQHNFPTYNDSLKHLALNFTQPMRTKFFVNDIPLTHIRRDLKLKSMFQGRGFGHGVGLSQEGGMKMADLGFTAYEIVQHYYQGVHIRNLSDLQLLAYAR